MSEILLLVGTVILSGFFSGAEITFVTANRLKLEILSRKETFASETLGMFLKHPERFLSTTLVGNNIVNVGYATLFTLIAHDTIVSGLTFLISQEPGSLTILLTETVIAALIILLFGEIFPKSVFRFHADAFARIISVPMMVIYIILRPIIYLADSISGVLVRLFGEEMKREEKLYRRQDIEALMEEIHDQGAADLDKEESEILTNVLELSNTRVKELMIPRTEIAGIEKSAGIPQVTKSFIESGFSKMPVYDESLDNIIGVVVAHDLFSQPKSLAEVTRPIRFVPSTQRAKSLLADFRKANDSIAIVLDEYGGTSGLITIEDLLEAVVGDIQDEYDTDEFRLKLLSDGSLVANASLDLGTLRETYPGFNLPESEGNYETIGGFITYYIGRIPRVNEEHLIHGFKFLISKATAARIEVVRITPILT